MCVKAIKCYIKSVSAHHVLAKLVVSTRQPIAYCPPANQPANQPTSLSAYQPKQDNTVVAVLALRDFLLQDLLQESS